MAPDPSLFQRRPVVVQIPGDKEHSVTSPLLDRDSSRTSSYVDSGSVSVRPFALEDAAAVAELFNGSEEGWPGGFTHGVTLTGDDILERQSYQQPHITYIAWDGASAAGYCSVFEMQSAGERVGY